jgi:hypothetical protein
VIGADSVRVPLFKEAFSALSHDWTEGII